VEYLPGFLTHPPLFLSIAVIQENIYLGKQIEGNLVRINMRYSTLALKNQFGLSIKLIDTPSLRD
jgi:hypothetical protein